MCVNKTYLALILNSFVERRLRSDRTQRAKCQTTFSNGCLGSHNDEERSEMRYVMRIAKSSESSKLWTQLALPRKYVCWSVCINPQKNFVVFWVSRLGDFIVYLNELRCNPLSFLHWCKSMGEYTETKLGLYDAIKVRRDVKSVSTTVINSCLTQSYRSSSWFLPPVVLKLIVNSIGPPISQEYPLNLSI